MKLGMKKSAVPLDSSVSLTCENEWGNHVGNEIIKHFIHDLSFPTQDTNHRQKENL